MTTTLRAEVLAEGVIGNNQCPVCGGQKHLSACTCDDCKTAEVVIGAVLEAQKKAIEAQQNVKDVPREVIFEGVLAQFKINKDSYFHFLRDEADYYECRRGIPGVGFIHIYAFGAEESDKGRVVTAFIELKTKITGGKKIPYLRAQVVRGARANVKLAIVSNEDAWMLNLELPRETVSLKNKTFWVGFMPVEGIFVG